MRKCDDSYVSFNLLVYHPPHGQPVGQRKKDGDSPWVGQKFAVKSRAAGRNGKWYPEGRDKTESDVPWDG